MYTPEIYPELSSRWKRLQTKLSATGTDACLIAGNVNLFYLTNRIYSGYFYIRPEGDPLFFVKRPIGLQGDNVVYIRKPEEIPVKLSERGIALPNQLLMETDELSYNEIVRLQTAFQAKNSGNATSILREVRTIKSEYEINLLRQSGKIHADCYREIPALYKNGMDDLTFSIEIEKLFRSKGSLGYFRVFGQSMEIFMGSILAGDNAMNPSPYDFAMGGAGMHQSLPVGCNGTPLTDGIAVMVDMGGTFTGYITDMTRVFSMGKLSDLAYRAHQTSIEIHEEIRNYAKPGTSAAELYHTAATKAEKNNLSSHFMGFGQQAAFAGHGIGIEINEAPVLTPRSKEILTEGHVFALEPKFVIPGVGAVGIENSYCVNALGIENLTVLEENIIELK